MSKDKKEGRHDNIETINKTIRAFTQDSVANKGKKDSNISTGGIQKLEKSAGNKQASANSPRNLDKRKGGKKDYGKSTGVIHAEMQSEMNVAENKSDKTTDKDSETSACDNQTAEKSWKRRRRLREKPASDTSRTESLASTEYERGFSDTFLDNPIFKEMLAARIAEIEAETTHPKAKQYGGILRSKKDANLPLQSSQKYFIKRNKTMTHSEKGKRNVTSNLGGEDDQYVSKDKQVSASAKVSQTDCSIQPVIYMADKATQTDPLQELPSNTKDIDAKSSATLNLDSNNTVVTEATESNLLLSPEATNLENISEHIDISKKKMDSFSSLSSSDESFHSITEDFVQNIEISSDNLEEEFIKCLKKETFI